MDNRILAYSGNSQFTQSKLRQQNLFLEYDQENNAKILKIMQKHKIRWFIVDEKNPLRKVIQAPTVCYYQGDLELLPKRIFAIVWPRSIDEESKQILEKLFELIWNTTDWVTISWLAEGVDQKVHELSIKYKIPTIAVLGWGFFSYFNSAKRRNLDDIIQNNGLVLSDFKLFESSSNYSFPQRNRIIAGLSDLVFLPSAGPKSWSLITVDYARKQGKRVFWTPQSIFSSIWGGINEYIAKWFITPVYDLHKFVEEELWIRVSNNLIENNENISFDSEDEQKVYTLIKRSFCNIDQLWIKTNLSIQKLQLILCSLELWWYIKEIRPGEYQ